MTNCCGIDAKSICEQFKCKITENSEGIQINISPKDASKVESFEAMISKCKDFCKCDCC